jgi:hypothetical protein
VDGVVTTGEWDKAFLALNLPNGSIRYMNDSQYLYMLIDLTGDTIDDPPQVGSPWGDFYWLAFDVNENQVVDSNQDFFYSTYPGTYTLGLSYYLGSGSFSGIKPSISKFGAGFGKSMSFAISHRIWEFALDYTEIKAAAGQMVAFGIYTYSQNPSFADKIPADMTNSVASFKQITLDAP